MARTATEIAGDIKSLVESGYHRKEICDLLGISKDDYARIWKNHLEAWAKRDHSLPTSPNRKCQFIAGDPAHDPSVCGDDAVVGTSWCPKHHKVVFQW